MPLTASLLVGVVLLLLAGSSPVAALGAVVGLPVVLVVYLKPSLGPCLLILSVLAFLSTGDPVLSYGSVEMTYPDLAFLLMVVVAFGKVVFAGERVNTMPRELTYSLAIMFCATMASAFVAVDKVRAAAGIIQVVEFSLLAWAASQIRSHRIVLGIMHFTLAVLLCEAFLAFWQLVRGITSDPTGTFVSNQQFGPFMGWGAAMAFGFAAGEKNRQKRGLYIVVMGILALASVAGEKRAAWLSLFVAMLGVSVYLFRRRKAVLIYFALGVSLAILMAVSVPQIRDVAIERLKEAPQYYEQGNTLQTRLTLWKFAWQLFRQQPLLGVGPKNFLSVVPYYLRPSELSGETTLESHNVWVGMLAEQGIVGFVAYVFMCFAILRLGIRKLRAALHANLDISFYLAYIAYNLFWFAMSYSYFTKGTGHVHFLILGLTAGIAVEAQRVPSRLGAVEAKQGDSAKLKSGFVRSPAQARASMKVRGQGTAKI